MAERVVIEEFTKIYPGGKIAMRDISFSVEPGEFIVLLGPSGSGKSTLLRAIAGIECCTSGTMMIGAASVDGPTGYFPPEQRELSMVFQDYALWPHLTVLDNVAFALKRRKFGKEQVRARAQQMLERVGLDQLAQRHPSQLSGGEQQRVALTRALVGDTGLVLCDEPLSNLDADLRVRLRTEISTMVREAQATTIYITHDQEEAFALADKIGVLDDGKLVQFDAPEEVYRESVTLFVARFTGLAGEINVTGAPHPIDQSLVNVIPVLGTSLNPIEARKALGVTLLHPLVLTVRSGAVELTDPTDFDAQLRGVVADTAFCGRHYEVTVDLENGGRLHGIESLHRPGRGETVGLSLSSDGCMVFNDFSNSEAVETSANLMEEPSPQLIA